MKIKVLKGTNQIGGCITEISTSSTKIIIDFGDNLDGNKMFDMDGLTKGCKKYDAVFITHSHGDHIGNVNKILKDIDIYIEDKGIKIHNITCDFKREYDKKIRKEQSSNIKELFFEQTIIIGDIKITPFIVDHSAYNASMFLIEADNKKILHTGDFRMHGRKGKILENTLKKIGNVDLLITEGTTLTRINEKYLSEIELQNELNKIIKKYDQVYFMTSSTNIDRIVSFYKAVCNTHLFIEDLCMASITAILPNIPNSNSFKNVYTYMSEKYRGKKEPYERYKKHLKNVIDDIHMNKRFAMSLKSSMYDDLEKNKKNINNACLIYSMWEGYIDERRKDDNTKKLIEFFENLNVDIYYKHTSGHASKATLKLLNHFLNPTKVLIIHTEDKNKALEESKKIFENKVLNIEDNAEFII